MNGFVHPDLPSRDSGIDRMASAIAVVRHAGSKFSGAKGLAALLVAAAFSALVVVADHIVSTWADGQLLMAWIALWVLLFAAVALFAEATQGWSEGIISAVQAWSAAAAQRAEDERTWSFAQSDPRFMAELQAARMRAENYAHEAGLPPPRWPFDHIPMHSQAQHKWM